MKLSWHAMSDTQAELRFGSVGVGYVMQSGNGYLGEVMAPRPKRGHLPAVTWTRVYIGPSRVTAKRAVKRSVLESMDLCTVNAFHERERSEVRTYMRKLRKP